MNKYDKVKFIEAKNYSNKPSNKFFPPSIVKNNLGKGFKYKKDSSIGSYFKAYKTDKS